MRHIRTKGDWVKDLGRNDRFYSYSALDSALTLEIHQAIDPRHTDVSRDIYEWSLAQRNSTLVYQMRGIKVDPKAYYHLVAKLTKKAEKLERRIRRISLAIQGEGLNPRSTVQITHLLHDKMRLPKVRIPNKGEMKESVSREALEKLHEKFVFARPFITHLLALRDTEKLLGSLKTYVSKTNWRFHSSYNIAGTETGRYSSTKNAFGLGASAQTITEQLKEIFIADPGFILVYIDLQQAESYGVGYLSGDQNYIDACESGDLHTTVAKMVWPEQDWTGDINEDRTLAEKPFYRHFSQRDMCKKLGHGSNYYGTARTMARHTKIPVNVVSGFQTTYFNRFSGIRRWHSDVKQLLEVEGYLETPFGRGRHFFGRKRDDSTLRKAIAFLPQSTIADYLNLGAYRVFKKFHGSNLQILAQIHDAILVQVKVEELGMIEDVKGEMGFPIEIRGRSLTIPTDAEFGYRWNHLWMEKDSSLVPYLRPMEYIEAGDFDILNLPA